MALSVAYNANSLTVVPGETRPTPKTAPQGARLKAKSIFTIAREKRFEKAALKKLAPQIAAIQEHYPNWQPIF